MAFLAFMLIVIGLMWRFGGFLMLFKPITLMLDTIVWISEKVKEMWNS